MVIKQSPVGEFLSSRRLTARPLLSLNSLGPPALRNFDAAKTPVGVFRAVCTVSYSAVTGLHFCPAVMQLLGRGGGRRTGSAVRCAPPCAHSALGLSHGGAGAVSDTRAAALLSPTAELEPSLTPVRPSLVIRSAIAALSRSEMPQLVRLTVVAGLIRPINPSPCRRWSERVCGNSSVVTAALCVSQ